MTVRKKKKAPASKSKAKRASPSRSTPKKRGRSRLRSSLQSPGQVSASGTDRKRVRPVRSSASKPKHSPSVQEQFAQAYRARVEAVRVVEARRARAEATAARIVGAFSKVRTPIAHAATVHHREGGEDRTACGRDVERVSVTGAWNATTCKACVRAAPRVAPLASKETKRSAAAKKGWEKRRRKKLEEQIRAELPEPTHKTDMTSEEFAELREQLIDKYDEIERLKQEMTGNRAVTREEFMAMLYSPWNVPLRVGGG